MVKNKPLVGFDRYVEIEWLDQAAKLVIEGKSLSELNSLLDEYLMPFIDGETSRRKTKNILTATWAKASDTETAFKSQAKDLFKNANSSERLAIQYGVSVATYPYFLELSKILGRLFKLQDSVSKAGFTRRVVEVVGDRESIKRAATRYLQSLVQWKVLAATETFGVKPCNKVRIENSELITWLYSAVLISSQRDKLSIDDITSDPVWFPFDIANSMFDIHSSRIIKVLHQGVGNTLVTLAK